LVLLAFTLMVISSYLFVSITESRHLKRSAENAILYTEASINSDMQGLETLLGVVSETITDMIKKGEDSDAINEYILFINNYVEASSGRRLHGATGIFGVFDIFDGMMLIGYEGWIPTEDYYQTDRPWYTGAVKAAGEISITDPYLNAYSNKITITLSRRIFDENGDALGIICLNIELTRIAQYAVSAQFIEDGYGFLLSENFMIIAHPNATMVGLSFRNVKSGIAALIDEVEQKGSISEVVTSDYRGVQCIVFVHRLQNGWYMGVVTPRGSYFQSTRILALTLTVFGVIFAALLIWMLLKISAEKAMTDERMKIMFNATPLVAYIFDKNYKVIDCNYNAVTLFDLSGKQEFCDRFYDLSSERQPDGSLIADIGKEIAGKMQEEGHSRFEWTFRKFNGELIPCEITCTRVMYKKDFTTVGYMRDMREQKKMLEVIQQRARLLDTVYRAATILLSNNAGESFEVSLLKSFELVGRCLDVDRVQIWCNDVFENEPHFVLRYEWLSDYGKNCKSIPMGLHFPYSKRKEWHQKFINHEYINAPVCELPAEDRAFLMPYDMKSIVILPMYLEGDFWGFFSIVDCRNERALIIEEISILASAGLMMSSAVNRNIQAVKMREAEKRTLDEIHKAEIAEESNKAKSDFLARMSHEIRTPMNAILGITEIQLQDETHSPLTKEAFERIFNSSSLLLGIINDILDLSKIEAGKMVLTPSQYDIASLIHDTVQLNILRYETKPIEFILDVKEDLPLLLIGDELRIKQILNNLLSNAFKYTEEGTVKLTVYVEPADLVDASKKTLVFIVSDTGQGMTAEQIQKLGTEYSRFNMEANRKTEGTGLGMNITRNLIQLMVGSISIESVPGAGSTFTVRLPQDCNDPAGIGKEIANNLIGLNFDNSVKLRDFQLKREYMPYGRVLVVDDVETNLYVARGLIAPYGISVETALSGFEAIDKIKNGLTYDIIFMDHMMPIMDGIEAVKVIRELGYSKPIVALTANALAGQATMFMENGFDDFISKPIDMRHLNITLNKLIRDKYPADVVEASKKQKDHLYSGGTRKKSLGPELVEVFGRDAKKAIAIMETIYLNNFRRDEDVLTFVINAHAMKSALANIGETALSADAANLEQAGRDKNIKLILAELPSFLEMLNAVLKKTEYNDDKIADNADDSDSDDTQYLREQLLTIKEACALYDKKAAKNTLAEIRKDTWSKPVNKHLSEISAHLLHSDFEKAAQVIDDCVLSIS
jgi:signal transduction histidine kinase/CheY-like chemotaxis protein/PAS domain-containing protein/HPt (histidine-containing phosphotransfer) domain-containing protein